MVSTGPMETQRQVSTTSFNHCLDGRMCLEVHALVYLLGQ